jgi:glycosyltransferase involved in cell wall biosynthesis
MKKKAIVSVINDLSTDQRVHKTCLLLQECGFEVLLVGRKLKNSIAIKNRTYQTKRMNLLFSKGPFFYAEFHIRLFFFLMRRKNIALYFANDLDTLLPNYLVSKLKQKKIVYDSHEYFTEVPELQNSFIKKAIWKSIERQIVPQLKLCITVNESIASLFRAEYKNSWLVVRNMPHKFNFENKKTRKELGIPLNEFVFILQGSGINIDRGAEELIEAMQWVNGFLYIIGSGDVFPLLKEKVQQKKLENKVTIIDKIPFEELMQYTTNCNIGLTLDKDTNLNYKYSLPNKIFDYIQAGIPILGTNLIEYSKIVKNHQIGFILKDFDAENLAKKMNEIIENKTTYNLFKQNAEKASMQFIWENETLELKKELTELFKN